MNYLVNGDNGTHPMSSSYNKEPMHVCNNCEDNYPSIMLASVRVEICEQCAENFNTSDATFVVGTIQKLAGINAYQHPKKCLELNAELIEKEILTFE